MPTLRVDRCCEQNGIVMVIYQPLVFPRLQRRFGNVRCYRGGTISMNILLLVFPFYHFLWDKGWVLWAAIGVQRLWEVATATAMWMPSFIMVSTITCTHDLPRQAFSHR